MRTLDRITQAIWVANEIGFEVYGTPFMFKATVSPVKGIVEQDQFISLDYLVQIQTTSKQVKDKGITASSMFWIGRGNTPPDPDTDGATHKIKNISVSTDLQNVTIVLRQQEEYNPLG